MSDRSGHHQDGKRQKTDPNDIADRLNVDQDAWVKSHKELACWITDAQDERAKPFTQLKDGQADGFFIAEGTETVRMLLQHSPAQIISIFLKPNKFFEEPVNLRPDILSALKEGAKFQVLLGQEKIMSSIAGFHIARGCLAYGRIPTFDLDTALQSAQRVVALDCVSDTANLGSIVRTASCLGVDAIVLSQNSCDAWYRRAIRVSMGHCFRIPIVRVEDLSHAITSLQANHQITSYASLVTEESQPISKITQGTRTMFPLLHQLTILLIRWHRTQMVLRTWK